MRMLKFVLAVCVLALCHAQDSRTIFQFLQDDPKYSKLTELVLGAGLAGDLQKTDALPITLFAPTNDAFAALPLETQTAIQTDATLLKTILLGHISPETILGFFIRDGLQKQTEAQTTLNFNSYANGVKTVNGAPLGTDVLLANGVVHTISKVLTPVDKSVSEVVSSSDPEFRDLFGFLVLAHLYGTLSTGGPYTVFAPTDGAFESVDVSSLVMDVPALTDVLLSHVVSGSYWSAGLTDGMTLTTLNNKTITIHTVAGVSANNAGVVTADIGATNGVIHVVDKVIIA